MSASWPIPTLPSSFCPFSFGAEGTILLSTRGPPLLAPVRLLQGSPCPQSLLPLLAPSPLPPVILPLHHIRFLKASPPPKPHPSKWIPLPLMPTQPEQYTKPALCTFYFSSLRKLGVCSHYRCEWPLGQFSSVNILNMHTFGRDLSFLCVCSLKKKKIIRNSWVSFLM